MKSDFREIRYFPNLWDVPECNINLKNILFNPKCSSIDFSKVRVEMAIIQVSGTPFYSWNYHIET